jgi:hypothetical protein
MLGGVGGRGGGLTVGYGSEPCLLSRSPRRSLWPWVEGGGRHSPGCLVGAGTRLGGAATGGGRGAMHRQQRQQQCRRHRRRLPFPWGCTPLVGDGGGGGLLVWPSYLSYLFFITPSLLSSLFSLCFFSSPFFSFFRSSHTLMGSASLSFDRLSWLHKATTEVVTWHCGRHGDLVGCRWVPTRGGWGYYPEAERWWWMDESCKRMCQQCRFKTLLERDFCNK